MPVEVVMRLNRVASGLVRLKLYPSLGEKTDTWHRPYRRADARFVLLPIVARFRRVISTFELIAFAIDNKNHANRHERGRHD
jgi:hypothetical protein